MTRLDPTLLLAAYAAGIFPMADSRDARDLFWVEPERRAILPLDGFHLSRSLRKTIVADTFTAQASATTSPKASPISLAVLGAAAAVAKTDAEVTLGRVNLTTANDAVIRASARNALWRPTMWRAMSSASASTCSASVPTTASIASSNSSGKRDMCTPFCARSRSTVHSISAAITVSRPSWRTWIALATRVTPARVSDSSTSGAEAHLPFGGNGKSGNGSRQSGMWVLDQFTRWQSMNWDYAGKLQKAQMDVVEIDADEDFRLDG